MTGPASKARDQLRAEEAQAYDSVADSIDGGRLTIRGAHPSEVRDRLRSKAARSRAGEHVWLKPRSSLFVSYELRSMPSLPGAEVSRGDDLAQYVGPTGTVRCQRP